MIILNFSTLSTLNTHAIKDIAFDVIVGCSIAHSVLPPWDFLNDFPRTQKVYKALVYLVGWFGVNVRSTVYQTLSVSNPNGVNAPNGANGANAPKQP